MKELETAMKREIMARNQLEPWILRHMCEPAVPDDYKADVAGLDVRGVFKDVLNYLIRENGYYRTARESRIPENWPNEDIEAHIQSIMSLDVIAIPTLTECIMRHRQHTKRLACIAFLDWSAETLRETNPIDWPSKVSEKLGELIEAPNDEGWEDYKTMMEKTKQHIEDIQDGKIKHLEVGIDWFDERLKTQHGDFVVLAARPGLGKTALILNIIGAIARAGRHKAAIVELEMTNEAMGMRIVSAETGVYHSKLKNPSGLSDYDKRQLAGYFEKPVQKPIYFNSSPGMRWSEITRELAHAKALYGIEFAFIDNLSLIRTGDHRERLQEVSFITKSMKHLARSLGIVLFAVVHMNRQIEARNGAEPQMSDLRESGTIEQDADTVMFLTEEKGKNELDDKEIELKCWVKKARHGPTSMTTVVFDKRIQRFRLMTEAEEHFGIAKS